MLGNITSCASHLEKTALAVKKLSSRLTTNTILKISQQCTSSGETWDRYIERTTNTSFTVMINIEYNAVVQLLIEKLGVPQPVLISLLFTMLISWICWRTRSTHLVMTQVWRLFFGKVAVADHEISQFIESRTKLSTFRFFSGLPVRTLIQAKHLIRWSVQHNEEISDIKACGELFDLETGNLREDSIPSRALSSIQLVASTLLACAVAFCLVGLFSDLALLQFKTTKTWFLLSDQYAKSWSGDEVITPKLCAKNIGETLKSKAFTRDEVAVICNGFGNTELHATVKETLVQQRSLFGTLGLVFTLWGWASWAAFRRGISAKAMMKRMLIVTENRSQ